MPASSEVHRDAAAHRAGADDRRRRSICARRRVLGDVGNLGGCALGEESVAQRARFRRLHELDEQLALEPQALVERHRDGRRDRVDALERRGKAAASAAPTVLRANWKKRFGIRVVDRRCRAPACSGRCCRRDLAANASAPCSRSPSTICVEQCRAAEAFATARWRRRRSCSAPPRRRSRAAAAACRRRRAADPASPRAARSAHRARRRGSGSPAPAPVRRPCSRRRSRR